MKFGTLSAKCWGLALADFGRDPRSSYSLRERAEILLFFVRQIAHYFSDFSSEIFYDISTQKRRSVFGIAM